MNHSSGTQSGVTPLRTSPTLTYFCMELAGYLFLILLAVLIARLMAGSMDKGRVHEYVASRGGRLLDQRWTPFGSGWFGEKNARIYQVVYEDTEGNRHRATVKTSMLSGVYLTNDEIIQNRAARASLDAQPSGQASAEPHDDLAAENARLRARIAELERQQPPGS